MINSIDIKVCGLKDPSHLRLAASSGVRYAGLVFYPRSPRHLSIAEGAALARSAPAHLTTVGLFVDPDDEVLGHTLAAAPLGMIQLHGDETPKRVQEIRVRTGLPVMKALKIAAPEDLSVLPAYEAVADWILFDAKSSGALPGGNGVAFDWQILKNLKLKKPWMLSGGLTAENVAIALQQLTPAAVDVSSGVEDAPGVKSTDKIRVFVAACKTT